MRQLFDSLTDRRNLNPFHEDEFVRVHGQFVNALHMRGSRR